MDIMLYSWYIKEGKDNIWFHHMYRSIADFVSVEQLEKLGVLYRHFCPDNYETNQDFLKFKSDRGYSYEDKIVIAPAASESYDIHVQEQKSFYEEHIHTDEEVRYVLEGSGFFDVRDLDDKWIRIHLQKGDLIVLPAGIYHRFTLDLDNQYIEAVRLFKGEPVWTPLPREQLGQDHPVVRDYRHSLVERAQ